MLMPSSCRLRLSNNCLANTMQLSSSPYAVIWQLSESYLEVKRLLCGNWYVVSHQRVKQSSNHRWVSSDSYLAIISQSPRNSQADNILNMSYLTDSYIVFILKIESVSKNTIFGVKIMVKSGLEKIFLKFLHAGDYFPLLHKRAQNHKFSNKNNYLPTWRDFKIFFSDVWISQVRRVKQFIDGLPLRLLECLIVICILI